ncbi:Ubiquinol oxidase 1a, mitochondrial [Morella rubra]|uniref:Ubiquinol oxidase n=1 Tax=Morella rubra TaxID=262757 RepID=A0A6A1VU57_9ROSI|nr:Ubiquinol oxidase 1a, mitochondrial [Morella rubra]
MAAMVMRQGGTRLAGSMMAALGPRLFSHSATTGAAVGGKSSLAGFLSGNPTNEAGMYWIMGVRNCSTGAQQQLQNSATATTSGASAAVSKDETEKNEISSYWGVPTSKLTNKDGTEWKWSCFRPWETYQANTAIDMEKHHAPGNLMDRMAYWTVKRRFGCRAMMLETVAAVPGMVAGMLLHCKSLRSFEHSGGWIKALLEEAENERMHLMTFMEVSQPTWLDRALVFTVQGIFFNAYLLGYVISPKFAHRMVGYLEEEAIHSYTEFLKELDNGNIENVPAPAIAIDYWQLPTDATLRDVVLVVRADEAHHRDVNHFASDIHCQGRQLREAPAPLGYH